MRCYFSLSNGREVLPDGEGVEYSSLDEAYTETVQAIHDAYRECDAAEFDWIGWTLTAVDAAGEVLFSVSLAVVVGRPPHSVGSINPSERRSLYQ
jgi:hypothetical protein